MNLADRFDRTVLIVLKKGIQTLSCDSNAELLVSRDIRLRRAIKALLATETITQQQSDQLTQEIQIAWQQALWRAERYAAESNVAEQQVAILHAQEYMHWISDAPNRLQCEHALAEVQRCLQSFKDCNLLDSQTHESLSHQALALVDDWKSTIEMPGK